MFSLMSKQDNRAFAGEEVVLPRWLRRPARMVQRLGRGEVDLPRFAATYATLALFGATAAYGAVAGGYVPGLVQGSAARTGFAIGQVEVSGNVETSEIDVLQEVGLDGWTALIGFDAEAARQRIAALPWVESVAVRKIYPAMLDVKIVEKKPFSIWQHGSQLTLVERDGSVIAPFAGGRYGTLPMVIGVGADKAGPDIVDMVARHPQVAARVKGYIRVADRRWDLKLGDNVTVKLPEKGVALALADLAELDRKYDVLSRDIASVDMRITDRLAVELTPEAKEARDAAAKARLTARRNSGARI